MTMSAARRAIGGVIVAWTLAGTATASSQQAPKLPGNIKDVKIAQANLSAYRSELRRYRRAGAPAVVELLAWEEGALRDAVTLINTRLDNTRPWVLDDIKAAVLLHTEAAARLLRDGEPDTAAAAQLEIAGRVLVRGADPQVDRAQPGIDTRNAEVRAFASRWYVAVSRFLRDRARYNAAHNLLALGRERLPHEAAVLYESGTMEEYVATFPSRTLRREPDHIMLTFGDAVMRQMIGRHAQQLSDAEGWFRESMALDSKRPDTALHLGRVLMLRGRDDESARLLERVAAESSEHSYLAHMFRGAIEERRGSLDAAREAYQRAATADPGGQSALIALSEVLQREGRGDESRRLLAQLLAAPSPAADPWSLYFVEPSEKVRARIEALFAELWR